MYDHDILKKTIFFFIIFTFMSTISLRYILSWRDLLYTYIYSEWKNTLVVYFRNKITLDKYEIITSTKGSTMSIVINQKG